MCSNDYSNENLICSNEGFHAASTGYTIEPTDHRHGGDMADIERISAQQAHAKIKANQALLVCAYEDEAKCRMLNLEGSISFTSFKSRVQSLPKSREIIFY